MTALYKRPGSKAFWTAWRDEHGKLYRKSTKCTKRTDGERVAKTMIEAFRRRKIAAHVREVCLSFNQDVTGEAMAETTMRAFADTWLATKKREVSPGTFSFYQTTQRRLLDHLAAKADGDINFITKADLVGFRDALATEFSGTTARHLFKAVKMIFRAARLDGALTYDPAEVVKFTRKAEPASKPRRPFTLQEIEAILGVCDEEWRGLVLFGLHTGQRLGDLVRLTWANVDPAQKSLHLRTQKTRKRLTIPLSQDLQNVLAARPASDGRPEDAPLFPRAWGIIQRTGRISPLSLQFTAILRSIGLREPLARTGSGKGKEAGREISFHSLRHSAVSMLKGAGVPDAVVMSLVGHETVAMSHLYTHVGAESLASAVATLPSFTAKK